MTDAVRMDKWLWAARFFKTRSLAKAAIEGGKVHCEGVRVKVSKEVKIGMLVMIRQGYDEKMVQVLGLSETRGPASVATLLYAETAESIELREKHRRQSQLQNHAHPEHRPSKKDRRQIHRFQDSWMD